MTAHSSHRGGFAVARISDLGSVEAQSIRYLRMWCDGPAAQAGVWNDFASTLGPDAGRHALRALEELCALCSRHSHRPLLRRPVGCRCAGADEACFAQVIAAASEGDREDALLIATMLVRADIAMGLMLPAEAFGLALKRMALKTRRDDIPAPQSKTLH